MIYLKKGQPLYENPGLVVYDPTGYYDDLTSVVCAPVFDPEQPAYRYEARYIAYGGIVYSVSDEEELLKQILEIDPLTLYGKDSKQVAIDKVVDEIVTQDPNQIVETKETPKDEDENKEVVEETPAVVDETPTIAPPTEILPPDNSTTTPSTIETSTTTSATTEFPTSTTTAPIIEDIPVAVEELPTIEPPIEILPTDPSNTTSTAPVIEY